MGFVRFSWGKSGNTIFVAGGWIPGIQMKGRGCLEGVGARGWVSCLKIWGYALMGMTGRGLFLVAHLLK
jgi:hypothetical protein